MKALTLIVSLFTAVLANAQIPFGDIRAVVVEPGDSVLVRGLLGEGMRLRTAWSLNRSLNPVRSGWSAVDQYIILQEQDQLDVGNYYLRSWDDTTSFVPSFIPFMPDTGRIPYRLPDTDWTVYIARVGPALPDTFPADTTNLLTGLSWRHILYDAKGSYENYADTLLHADTWEVPGVYAHTPQIVASGWASTQGDSLYVRFQAKGSISAFILDINTGPTGIESWAKHWVDTVEVSSAWAWYTAAFEAKYTDQNNRLDFNLGLDTGRVELRSIAMQRVPFADQPQPPDTIPAPAPDPCIPDTVYINQTDTLYLDVIVRDTVQVERIVRDTVRTSLYLIEELNGVELSRKKLNHGND